MRFEFPWAFLLLAALPFLIRQARHGKGSAALRFSSVKNARSCAPSWKMRFRHLPLLLRILAILLLTIGLARPQEGREEVRDVRQGIAIEMVVDRSGSMGQELYYEGRQFNRLEVVKKIFKEFVLGNEKDLKGRPNDLIGMVTFARYADTVCPLTLSHGALDRFIENIRIVTRKNEDGTAIGDGLALAAARLKTAEDRLKEGNAAPSSETSDHSLLSQPADSAADKDYRIKSKVIILLTDGQNNAGKRSPEEAARLAREWGIKVYAIGIGGRESFVTLQTPLGAYRVPGGPGVDEATLKAIAEETGGSYWLAESADKLHSIYKEIDKMEKTEIESVRYMDYAEKFSPFALSALLLLCSEQWLLSTLFRRIP
jgi:Ca-activated chloride channel family protein